jgi:hypothetical protein
LQTASPPLPTTDLVYLGLEEKQESISKEDYSKQTDREREIPEYLALD